MDRGLPAVILTMTMVGVILILGITVVGTVVDTTTDNTGITKTGVLLEGTEFVDVDDNAGGVEETVYNSRGYAVELTGADDSYVQSTRDIDVAAQDTWTVSVWASRNGTVTGQRTVTTVDGDIEIAYNSTRDEYTAWYYDAGSRASYRVNVSATASAGQFENIWLARNDSSLTIYANDTAGETATLDGTTEAAYAGGQNWNGRLDELRVWNQTLNASQRQAHYQDPIDGIPGGAQARVMFDEPYRSPQLLLYAGGGVGLNNATLTDGLAGQQLVTDEMLSQNDYQWRDDGPQIRAVSGGELDGAPIAYVDYKNVGPQQSLLNSFESAIGLAGLLLVLLPLGVIIVYLRGMQRR